MPGFTTDAGVTLHYEDTGPIQAPVLLFSHGSGWNADQWQPQVEALRTLYRCITWDMRGHRHSSLPDGPVQADDFTRDQLALLDYLDVDQAVLIGLSAGGHVALRTAAQHPARVQALVLIGTPFTNRFNWFERYVLPVNRLSMRFLTPGLIGVSTALILGRNPETRRYIVSATRAMRHNHYVRLWNCISRMESRHLLGEIQCPTLILEGDGDWFVHRQQAELTRLIPGAQHQLIPDAGHATNLDNPAAVTEAMQRFLASAARMS